MSRRSLPAEFCSGIPVFFIASLLLVAAGHAGTGEPVQAFPGNDTVGYSPVDIIVIDPAIKDATPDYFFLLLDDEGKETRLRDVAADIDILYPDENVREEMKARILPNLSRIWEKYPVVSVKTPGDPGYPTYGGSYVTMKFSPKLTGTIRLTPEENIAIEESAAIMNEAYARQKATINPAVSASPGVAAAQPTDTRQAPVSGLAVILATGIAGAAACLWKNPGQNRFSTRQAPEEGTVPETRMENDCWK